MQGLGYKRDNINKIGFTKSFSFPILCMSAQHDVVKLRPFDKS